MRYIVCIIVLTLSLFTMSASNGKNQLSRIDLVPSSEYISLQVGKKNTVVLPKYNIVTCSVPLSLFHMPSEDELCPFYLEAGALEKELAIRSEMSELSQKLGFEIKDRERLELYRFTADWLGTRYRMGGMSRRAVDCSGFTNLVYNNVFDKEIPRTSIDISRNLTEELDINSLDPGDLVFFATRGKKRINHVGVYLGDGYFVHASIKGGVKVSPLSAGYYQKTFKKAGKI